MPGTYSDPRFEIEQDGRGRGSGEPQGNAGHPHPLLRRAADGKVAEIGGRGTVLGRFDTATFEEEEIGLTPGDRFLLYTDGLVEATNPEGEPFGEQRLQDFLAEGEDLGSEELADGLLDRLGSWTAQGMDLSLDDDLTLVVVDVDEGLRSPES